MAQCEQDGFIGCCVAGMERRDDVGAAARQCYPGDCARYELHSPEIAFGGNALRCLDQVAARFDAIDQTSPLTSKIQIVENESEIGFSRAEVGQNRLRLLGKGPVECRFDQLPEMENLFQLTTGVGIECAIGREDVQCLEE